jgi:hypothetical protein
MRPYVVQHERQDEFFDQAERVEITIAANLVEKDLLLVAQKLDRIHSRERVRHEGPGEIEALVAADNVFDSPVRFYRSRQRFLIIVCGCNHNFPPFSRDCSKHCGSAALPLESSVGLMVLTMLRRPKKLTLRPA